ncbi:MAG: PQQ-binding-like beta-propeller repeat protein [Pseudomonadota bacterium]
MAFAAGSCFAIDPARVANSVGELAKGNWVTYNGDERGWHYSPLKQITTKNVTKLVDAWSHVASRARRGIESFPLAIDGVVYYTGPYNQLYAMDGATGDVLWTYKHKLNEDLVARQTHNPFNRGISAMYGNIISNTLDGKVTAVDMKTGKLVWETKLIDSEKITVGFTGIPMVVKDKIIAGSQGGEWPQRGLIYGVDAKTGKKLWEFVTVGGNDGSPWDRRDTWGNESWKVGGGGAWTGDGYYDIETNSYWLGTSNPAPLFDYIGKDWMTKGPRPGINLYTDCVLLLNPDTGALKAYYQEIPHDVWDFDSAVDGFYAFEQGGKKYVLHPNKGGFYFLYDRKGALLNVYKGVDEINWVKDITPKGELIGRNDMGIGSHKNSCPAINGGLSYNSGTYNPNTGLFYKLGYEWCMDLTVMKVEPVTEPVAQLYIGADFKFSVPVGRKSMSGHIRARDPVSGKVKFEINYPSAAPHSSLLSTAGDLLFVGEANGYFTAHDVRDGKKLWTHNIGIGMGGGVITYLAKGKQYVAVTTGWGSLFEEGYGEFFGVEPWLNMPQDSGGIRVFAIQ